MEAEKNNRAEIRRRTFKEGLVSYEEDRLSVPCLIRDMAEGGAKLRFERLVSLPKTFNLTIPLDGKTYPVELRWMQGTTCGVQITGPARPSRIRHHQVMTPDMPALDSTQPTNRTPPPPEEPKPGPPTAPKKVFGRLR